ncbi:expressed unknown protein [Seminavis robusta]|uniref:Uncharacterized protein n=1 Tax=Seminavis robusta TaxID=568900 RepID=A0A9N8EFY8_9STRA|nr:expressed unknown protein [Seminavis robusta]|eukprot:Sro1022_g232360.1 n/a (188) ;mRNA; r:15801-16364
MTSPAQPLKAPAIEDLTSTDFTASTVASTASTNFNDSMERLTRVGFSSIQIRSFDRILGDNPDVRSGPPLSIGWEYEEGDVMDLNAYELGKRYKDDDKVSSKEEPVTVLTVGTRRDMLTKMGVRLDDIIEAENEVYRIKKNRQETMKQSKVFERTEEMLQSAKRKLKRTLFARKNPKPQPLAHATTA